MRLLTILTVILVVMGGLAFAPKSPGKGRDVRQKSSSDCPSVKKALIFYRAKTWALQDELEIARFKTSYPERWSTSCTYIRYHMGIWVSKSIDHAAILKGLDDPISAIYHVFKNYGIEALAVASCESGGTFSTRAHNGQYLGMFQMGDYARQLYGHGDTALQQARAAHRYFVASGKDWSPWSCKP